MLLRALLLARCAVGAIAAATGANVLIIINDNSAESRDIGGWYAQQRALPSGNVCRIRTTTQETISRDVFEREIATPVLQHLNVRRIGEGVLYMVTTLGVPLRIEGSTGLTGDCSSVDSELTLLYDRLHGMPVAPPAGPASNPFFQQREVPFSHPRFRMYLVTRLAGYTVADAKALVSRCRTATNRGRFVIDSGANSNGQGNDMLERAARLLPKGRVLLNSSSEVLYGLDNVIGYASWGSNDPGRKRRQLGFKWLPGAIMTEFVSSNARTFQRPPGQWNISDWNSRHLWFAGSPQSLTADYVAEGVSGASGHVYEPYLTFTPHPDFLLPAWADGRNLAESYWLSIPALSWQNVVVGDPLCSLGKP
jgi:uncharacterized protein (TIGR03790 family)